jgi:hypothetical protein
MSRNSSRSGPDAGSSGETPNAAPIMPRAPLDTCGRMTASSIGGWPRAGEHRIHRARHVGRRVGERAIEIEEHGVDHLRVAMR